MKIIKAKLTHLSAINELNDKYFKEIRDFKKLITNPGDHFYVGIIKNKVVGFTGFHYYHWNNTTFIIDIFVHPDYRGKGYGSFFIKRLVQDAKKTRARTIMAEAPSLNKVLFLYLKNNFKICGFNNRYYSNSGDEIAWFLAQDLK